MLHSAVTQQLISAFLLLCSVTLTCGFDIVGTEGQSVTLPCTYKVSSTSDLTTMCWGKDACPSSKCNQPLIWTDGYKVTFKSSNHYELNGRITQGIVSLTIKSLTLRDQGTYCCRVEHHGWFNDMKLNIRLVVKKAPVTTKATTTTLRTTTRTIITTAKPTTIPTTMLVLTTGNFITDHEDHHTTESPTLPPTWVPHCNETGLPAHSIEPNTAYDIITKTYGESSREAEESDLPNTEFTTSAVNENRSPRETTKVNTIYTIESSSSPSTTQVDKIHPEQGPQHNSQPGSSPLSGNITIVETQKAGIPLYVLITVISVSVILVTMVTLLVLKLRGKGSGAYFFHQNPSLELVTHADDLAEDAQEGVPEVSKADWEVTVETNTDNVNNEP
ncbi:epatitis A virus cellular receptor 1 L homeolog precursor [Xenopus laevis]|uniref:Epatitis A virus cellular receptor 1 L homeolog precursor n=1 Tax=Xenopus laevis TaxID=8355 RepID=Q2TAD8_XENLA|nr:epatitis A virus cellular receptor 1 L homeolog precursor [Xenopus laevis]AAI10976.1 LOC432271 protein [Xenopus laevis]